MSNQNKGKVSKRVRQEIDFIARFFGGDCSYTDNDAVAYFETTVLGTRKEGVGVGATMSPLFAAKRNLDMTIKMWRQDILSGLLSLDELYETYGEHPYGVRLLRSIRKGIEFRHYTQGRGEPSIVAGNILFGDARTSRTTMTKTEQL